VITRLQSINRGFCTIYSFIARYLCDNHLLHPQPYKGASGS
jgi:hypothetical protein